APPDRPRTELAGQVRPSVPPQNPSGTAASGWSGGIGAARAAEAARSSHDPQATSAPGVGAPLYRPGTASGRDEPGRDRPAAVGPATQAAGYVSPTKPGLTDPSGGGRGGGGQTDRVTGVPDGYVPGGARHRAWYRSPAPLAAICAAAVVLGGGAFFLTNHSS